MTTSTIQFRGASIPSAVLQEADLPFPQGPVMMRLGADWYTADVSGRAELLTDYKAGADYNLGTTGRAPVFTPEMVNGVQVLDGTATVGSINDYDGYGVSSTSGPIVASEAFGDKEAITIAALVQSPEEDADFSVGPTLVGGSTSGQTAAMIRLYYPAARAISLTARHSATADAAAQCNFGGVVPGRWSVVVAEVAFADKWIAIEVDGVRRQVPAFAGKTGNSVTPGGMGLGIGMQRMSAVTRNGSQFTGKLRELVWFNGLLDAAGKRALREYLRPYQRRLNGEG